MTYNFAPEKDKEAFERFVLENGGNFLHSVKWAEVKTAWKPYFYSGFDENGNRVLTALILERFFPGAGRLWYCPSGAVCDYGNGELFAAFTKYIKGQLRKHFCFALFFDPCVKLRVNGVKQPEGKAIHGMFLKNGYILNSDASKCLYKAPVQLMLNVENKTPEQLLKSFEKGVRYSVRVGQQRGLYEKVYTIEDIKNDPAILDDFAAVMSDTSERNDFLERDSNYIDHLMTVFGPENMDLMLVYYDKKADRKLQEERLERRRELEKQLPDAPQKKIRGITEEIESIDKQTEHFEERMNETASSPADTIAVAGGLTLHYNGMSSCIFGGARNLLRNNLRASHYFNFRRICHTMEKGNRIHDLGYVLPDKAPLEPDGTLGVTVPREDFKGILDFKLSFGSDLEEYIGEYVLVMDKAGYYSYTHLLDKAKKVFGNITRLIRRR